MERTLRDMTHSHHPETGFQLGAAVPVPGHGQAEQTYFAEAEWRDLRETDKTAAKHIVGLMVGIFITGLILYSGVALWVANRPV
jgi:hypothetical protein